jgi:hypothetical protein
MKPTTWIRIGAAAATLAGLTLAAATVLAYDHRDSPRVLEDPAADLSDLYVWHANDRVYAIITFAGRRAPESGQTGTYDAGVLYRLHIGYDSPSPWSEEVLIRFGQNRLGQWGVQVDPLPGAERVTGPVEEVITTQGGLRVFAGLRDDPFFFDLQGLEDSLATSSQQFDRTRDSFAGTNATAIVLEMAISHPNPVFWVSSSREPR